MDILFLLVPFSVLLVFALMALFSWALGAGQFDDLEREGERILDVDMNATDRAANALRPAADSAKLDADQTLT